VFEYEDVCRENITEAIEKGKVLCSEFKLTQKYLDTVERSNLEYKLLLDREYSFLLERIVDLEGNVLWNNNKNFFEESVVKEKAFDAIRGELTNNYGKYIVNFAIRSFDSNRFLYKSVQISANYPVEAIKKAASMLVKSVFPAGEYVIRPQYVFDLETDYAWEPEEDNEEVDSSIQLNWVQKLIEQENLIYYQGKVDFVFEEETENVLHSNEAYQQEPLEDTKPRKQKETEFVVSLYFYIRNYPFNIGITSCSGANSSKIIIFERSYTICDSEDEEAKVMAEVEESIQRFENEIQWVYVNRQWIVESQNPFLEKVELGFTSRKTKPKVILHSKATSRYSIVYEVSYDDMNFNLKTEVLLPSNISVLNHAKWIEKVLDQTLSIELISIEKTETGDIVWSRHF
jgi:hypothetical protein